MIKMRQYRLLACLVAYAIMLHGLLFAGLSAAHASAMADLAVATDCAPSLDPDQSGGDSPAACDCGPMCLHTVSALAAPDLVDRYGEDLAPVRALSLLPVAQARHVPNVRAFPHVSRAPPALILT
jgi:hypothetical protein